MKNLVFLLVSVFTLSFGFANAQSLQSVSDFSTVENSDVEILKNFKANKQQKKVIKKIRNYVSPRLLSDNPYASALEGKKAKVQVNFDENGAVSEVTVIESDVRGLDAKFENLIKEFISDNPKVNSEIDRPGAIQLEIPLVAKKYTL